MRSSVELCAVRDVPTLMPCAVAMLGGALAYSNRAEEAVVLLEKAIQDRIYLAGGVYGEFFIRLHLGVALRQLGRWQQAITVGEQAVELAVTGEQHGHRADALFALGETLRCVGQVGRAAECLDQALVLSRRCGLAMYLARVADGVAKPAVATLP